MKRNKANLLAIMALGGLMACGTLVRADDSTTTPAPATPPADSGARPHRGGGKMLEPLNLTDDQKPKVMEALKDQREKMTALRDDSSLSGDDRKAKRKEITEATDAKMKTILTADQYTKWEEIRKKMQQHGPGGNGPKPGADAPPKSN